MKRCIFTLLEISLFVCVKTEIVTFPDDGGWSTDPENRIAIEGPCNIPVRDLSLTQSEFLYKYAYKQPVIVPSTQSQVFKDLCRRYEMMKNHGDKRIRLSSANTHSYTKKDVSLQEYVMNFLKPQQLDRLGNETFYWFGDNNYTDFVELFSSYDPPAYTLPDMTAAYSFGVAAAGTGVPFHFHGPGFAEVVYGLKRWFLYPPHDQPHFDPNKTTLHWLVEEYPKLEPWKQPLECTIGPGQAIYFPDHWWHGTLNVNTSVFISTFLAH